MNYQIMKYIVVILCGYLLGMLNIAVAISSAFMGGDVRKEGSGNAGATNMARTYGMGPGLITLAGDMLKTVIAVLVGRFMLGDIGMCVGGLACMLGHCFPVIHNFKGGKGIAVGAAIALVIDWRVFLVILISFAIVAVISKKVSAGSIAGAVMIVPASLFFHESIPLLCLAAGAMCITIFCHRTNIKRLINGTEPDFRAGKPKKEHNTDK